MRGFSSALLISLCLVGYGCPIHHTTKDARYVLDAKAPDDAGDAAIASDANSSDSRLGDLGEIDWGDARLVDMGVPPNLTCNELFALYSQTLVEAKICDPQASADPCTITRKGSLRCGCETFVNVSYGRFLSDIQAAASSCSPSICPAIACIPPKQGSCRGYGSTGLCVDDNVLVF